MRLGPNGRVCSRHAITAAIAGSALVAAAVAGGPATADLRDDKRKVEAKIEKLHDDLDDTSKKLIEANALLEETQAKLPAARNALSAAQQAQADAQARNEQAKADLARAQADEQKASADLEATAAEMKDTQSRIANYAAQLYQEQGTGTLELALETSDLQQLTDRMVMADTLGDIQSDALAQLSTSNASLRATQDFLTATREKVADAQRATEATLAEARAATASAAQAEADLESLLDTREKAAAALDSEREAEKQRLAEYEDQSDEITTELKEIEARQRREAAERRKREEEERKRAAAAAAAAQNNSGGTNSGGSGGTSSSGGTGSSGGSGGSTNPPPSGGFLSTPVPGAWVSSEFGMRYHPILNYWRLHSGRDYAASCGTPVYAAAPGSIVSAGWGGGYGNQVVIAHGLVDGDSLATTYNHLERIVATGGSVARGQLVGYVGTTGLSTGCHLHFEARVSGVPKDPRNWL